MFRPDEGGTPLELQMGPLDVGGCLAKFFVLLQKMLLQKQVRPRRGQPRFKNDLKGS